MQKACQIAVAVFMTSHTFSLVNPLSSNMQTTLRTRVMQHHNFSWQCLLSNLIFSKYRAAEQEGTPAPRTIREPSVPREPPRTISQLVTAGEFSASVIQVVCLFFMLRYDAGLLSLTYYHALSMSSSPPKPAGSCRWF